MYDKKFEIVKRKYIIDYYKMAILYDKLNLKKEAIKYYQKVIDKSLDKTDSIYKYSKSRIDVLTEDIFFEGK